AGWPRSIQMRDIFFTPSPALADFNNDGKLEAVVYWWDGIEAKIYIIDYQGSDYPGWPVVISNNYTESSPVVADIDGNGVLDIVLGDETRFIYAWDINGNLIPGFPVQAEDAVRATPFLDDIDLDNDIDLVLHSWDQSIYAFDLTGTYNPGLAPWPTLQANSHRNGCIGFVVPTAVGGASFLFSVERNGIELTWLLQADEHERFDIRRSLVEDDNVIGYVTIASDMAAVGGAIRFDDPDVEMGRSYVYQLVSKHDPDDQFTSETIYIPVSRADLGQNYPNPFNPNTQIAYYVPETSDGHVSIVVYDVTGARVRTLENGIKTPGRHVALWDGRNDHGTPVGSGVYFYRMTQKGFTATKKMLLLK
ncbi:MAG: T9SS type A sorting domain-containing protein, partial [Candidatus Latescibacterota bacterium]